MRCRLPTDTQLLANYLCTMLDGEVAAAAPARFASLLDRPFTRSHLVVGVWAPTVAAAAAPLALDNPALSSLLSSHKRDASSKMKLQLADDGDALAALGGAGVGGEGGGVYVVAEDSRIDPGNHLTQVVAFPRAAALLLLLLRTWCDAEVCGANLRGSLDYLLHCTAGGVGRGAGMQRAFLNDDY